VEKGGILSLKYFKKAEKSILRCHSNNEWFYKTHYKQHKVFKLLFSSEVLREE
jgi:hypothetical protein